MKNKYVVIARASGFIFGTADAHSPAEACRIVDKVEASTHGREYFETDATGDWNYVVRTAPAGWRCADGCDEDEIARADRFPLAAYVIAF